MKIRKSHVLTFLVLTVLITVRGGHTLKCEKMVREEEYDMLEFQEPRIVKRSLEKAFEPYKTGKLLAKQMSGTLDELLGPR